MLEVINQILGPATIAAHFLLVASLLAVGWPEPRRFLINKIGKHGLLLAFLVATVATALSLFYSEVAGFAPCVLCWYQRIFLYPQIVLLGLALVKRERQIIDYARALAIFGAVIALYQVSLAYGGASALPCALPGVGVSCTAQYVLEFGYVTIPVMSLTAFLLIIFGLSLEKVRQRNMLQ